MTSVEQALYQCDKCKKVWADDTVETVGGTPDCPDCDGRVREICVLMVVV